MRRLLFVCPQGHIFRSLAKLKNGRIRQCSVCAGVVEDSSRAKTMAAARKKARAIDPKWGATGIQVFAAGRIERRIAA